MLNTSPMIQSAGKPLFTLETQYGNDGYAFWFKLLELLGTQDGLYYDCNNKANWMFLISRARIDEEIPHLKY